MMILELWLKRIGAGGEYRWLSFAVERFEAVWVVFAVSGSFDCAALRSG
jgi:hypothetical protein